MSLDEENRRLAAEDIKANMEKLENDEVDDDTGVHQVESLCMNCHENGSTKFLLIKIPYFRDIILESFECTHCHFKNNSTKAAGQIQEQGAKYTLEIRDAGDFDRQVVKGDTSIFKIETLGIEMPKGDGQLTNIEGLLTKILTQLESEQPVRKAADPNLYHALDEIIQKLAKLVKGESFPFTISLDDPSGNSWIAPSPHDEGNRYRRKDYPRTPEQNEELGLGIQDESESKPAEESTMTQSAGDPEDLDIIEGKVYTLPAICPGCSKSCVVNMQQVNIPHFKEVFIWSTVCDSCGYRTNEVKTGGAVPEKGRRTVLKVEKIEDLSRDILKSDTCAMASEELDLSVQPGTLGGRFTTIEGLLTQVRDQLRSQIFEVGGEDLAAGDSMQSEDKQKWTRFFDRLDSAINGDLKFTLVLEDPMASSYVQDIYDPEPDTQLTNEDYTRTFEEEDELGLKDMKTEGYEVPDEATEKEAAEGNEKTS